ncbi:hypothetical protein Cgig2_002067 [Carnegiea gigantea]|uniref:Uncharacterized protein n=1 Tax=Carnegiea gigantea TaxID=171969 RepID=A0A9Q1GRW6_9CARY|nr:hypothetical protein Cgig2_002067 [Carnegiea gigantea]
MASTVSLTVLCAQDPSDLLHSMPLLLILKRLTCYSALITYSAHGLPSISHSSDHLLSYLLLFTRRSYLRLKSRKYLGQIVPVYTSMIHTSASWLWLVRVDEVPMMPCNRVTIMIKFRALIFKIPSFSSSLLSASTGYGLLDEYHDLIRNSRRLEFSTCSSLRSQVKDANNIILSLTETSNWYSHWMLPLFFVRVWICSAAISIVDAVYCFSGYNVITGHGLLRSTICSLLGLTSPLQECCRQRSIACITCFSYASPWGQD